VDRLPQTERQLRVMFQIAAQEVVFACVPVSRAMAQASSVEAAP